MTTQTIDYGGTISGMTIHSGQTLYIGAFGTASGIVVGKGGTEIIAAGGTIENNTVRLGGYLDATGGLASDTTIASGGTVQWSGAVSENTLLKAGSLVLEDDSLDTITTTAPAIVINSGETFVNVTGVDAIVLSGATEVLAAAPPYNESDFTITLPDYTILENDGSIDFSPLNINQLYTTNESLFVFGNSQAAPTELGIGGTYASPIYGGVGYGGYDIYGYFYYYIPLIGNYNQDSFSISDDGIVTSEVNMPCYLRNTRIAAARGEVCVEDLKIGDLLLTHAGHLRPIIWIGRRSYAGRFAVSNPEIMPVLIRASALADGVPRRDLFVSPQHAMFVDGMLIPAIYLVNGASIVRVERMEQVDYFHVELETHDVILAEGAPSETFVDCDSRTMFHNAHEFAALYPDDRSASWAFCALRVEDGEQLEAVRRRIAARAGLGADHVDDALKAGPLEGRIDLLDHTTIAGWAFDAARPHTPVRLEILVDDAVVGETLANLHRDDLRQAEKGEGRCAFSHHLAHPLTSSAPHAVQMRRIDDRAALLETPLLLNADPAQPGPLDGRIDVFDDACVAGWALDISRPDIPVRLEILAEGKLIGQTMAGCYRPDLEQAGLGNGRCSFMFRYRAGEAPREPRLVQVRRASDQAMLPTHRSQQAAA